MCEMLEASMTKNCSDVMEPFPAFQVVVVFTTDYCMSSMILKSKKEIMIQPAMMIQCMHTAWQMYSSILSILSSKFSNCQELGTCSLCMGLKNMVLIHVSVT